MAENQPDRKPATLDDPRQAEQEINSLAGVLSSRIVTNRSGQILEIHVVSSAERNAKQILRDIESTFLANRNIRVDRKKVSIAQYQGDPDEPPAPEGAGAPRPRFVNLRTTLTPDGGSVEVTLAMGGNRSFGEADFAIGSGPERAVAEATLLALERFVDGARFDAIHVETRPIGRHEAVFVHVESVRAGRSVPLLGSAIVQRDQNLSALHATLDAVNRYLGRLRATPGVEIVVGPEDE